MRFPVWGSKCQEICLHISWKKICLSRGTDDNEGNETQASECLQKGDVSKFTAFQAFLRCVWCFCCCRCFVSFSTYLFGCVGSWMRHAGFSLNNAGSFIAVCKFSCSATCGILVPSLGMEPVSSALQGGFFITGPPAKSRVFVF